MRDSRDPKAEPSGLLGPLLVGLYAWSTAVAFGMTVLDVMVARLVPDATAAFAQVADFLLLVSSTIVLLALDAIGLAWNSRVARRLLVASLAVGIFGLLLPPVLSPFLQSGPALGAGIRILIGGSVSALAFAGFYKYRSTE